jgi:superfamily I DNA/RNA helicase
MNQQIDKSKRYKEILKDRKAHVDAILTCQSNKITVVAGPGTGKTHLFKSILARGTKCLTLTFVNALVEDLSLELGNLSQVKTLHGYARSVLGKKVKVFPKLSQVIRQDAEILLGIDVDFDAIFHNREDDSKHIEFYKSRKSYYDNYYGYSSIIYAAVKLFESNKDRILSYHQVLVDEFQDFNKLEVSLVELLAEKSRILLAADDDQALYGFRGASADHIRYRHDESNSDYASFTLPYCSRCTRVIVEAVNDVLSSATEKGKLKGRIDKRFLYFEESSKDIDSDCFPQLDYAQVYAKQIPWFIENRLNDIADQQQGLFSCLIIAPTRHQCSDIVASLRNKGLRAVESVESKEGQDVTLLDGLKILMDDRSSNLGWRIVAKNLLSKRKFEKLLRQTSGDQVPSILDIVDEDVKRETNSLLTLIKKVKKGQQVKDEDLDTVLKAIGMDGLKIKIAALFEKITYTSSRLGNPGLRKVPIKVTTIQGSKGLDADFVFITYFDDRYFIKDKDKSNISDQDICNFIVSLARAKKKVFLISSNKNADPVFLTWIKSDRIKRYSE